jgi:hypothetical protein
MEYVNGIRTIAMIVMTPAISAVAEETATMASVCWSPVLASRPWRASYADHVSGGEPQKPLDPPMVPFAVAGIVAWAALGLVTWASGRDGWAQICLAGVLWGIVGLLVMLRHDAKRVRS